MPLRLTRDQARALGLPPPAKDRTGPPDGMNRLERSFRDDVLEAALRRRAIGRYWREPVKLRLAGRTFYTPDFLVEPSWDAFVFVETKGFLREDACVKIKVAAATYPRWRFLLAYREGRSGWRVHEVNDRGIGVNPIEVPWIHGG